MRKTSRKPLLAALVLSAGCAGASEAPASRPRSAPPSAASASTQPAPSASSAIATGRPPLSSSVLPLGSVILGGDLASLHAGRPVSYFIHHEKPEQLHGHLSAVHPEARAEPTGVRLGQGTLPVLVEARHRAPSFLVDSDQPAIQELAKQLPGAATPAAIGTLVRSHFTQVLYGEFWTASRAARKRAGDCSEHAVVSAAVARNLGLPARVVVGYVLVSDGVQGFAAGHAWAEVYDGKDWRIVDATPIGAEGPRYLVAGELTDEGPSYTLSLVDVWGSLQASGIDILRD
jgi:hypothetical protein